MRAAMKETTELAFSLFSINMFNKCRVPKSTGVLQVNVHEKSRKMIKNDLASY